MVQVWTCVTALHWRDVVIFFLNYFDGRNPVLQRSGIDKLLEAIGFEDSGSTSPQFQLLLVPRR
jgi:hypothetical protein